MKSEDLVRTIAHELGHGAFGLEHTFDPEYGIDDRYNNLMGYGKGDTARLFKFQWDIAHNSKAGEDEFEDAEEVMSKEVSIDDFYILFTLQEGEVTKHYYATTNNNVDQKTLDELKNLYSTIDNTMTSLEKYTNDILTKESMALISVFCPILKNGGKLIRMTDNIIEKYSIKFFKDNEELKCIDAIINQSFWSSNGEFTMKMECQLAKKEELTFFIPGPKKPVYYFVHNNKEYKNNDVVELFIDTENEAHNTFEIFEEVWDETTKSLNKKKVKVEIGTRETKMLFKVDENNTTNNFRIVPKQKKEEEIQFRLKQNGKLDVTFTLKVQGKENLNVYDGILTLVGSEDKELVKKVWNE